MLERMEQNLHRPTDCTQGVPNGHSNQKGIDRKTGKNFYEKQIFAIVRDIVVSVDYCLVCSSRNGVYPVLRGSFNVYTQYSKYYKIDKKNTITNEKRNMNRS
jgi:hypothetical protein